MENFREQVQRIVHSDMELEEKRNQLLSLGLTNADVEALLYREYRKRDHAEAERNAKRDANINRRIAEKAKEPGRSRQMKCLAIRQPWATLIAAGIKDVECRINLVPPCKRFLIAASKSRAAKRLDDVVLEEQLDEVNGYIAKGILPPYEEWPTGAIIGYVDIDYVTYNDVDSPWGHGHDGIKYVLKNAHMFDKPIYGKNKATPLFYNVDGYDEQHLPAAHVILPKTRSDSSSASAAKGKKQKSPLGETATSKDIHIPHTIEECFVELDKILSDKDKKAIMQLGDKSSLDSLHFTLGMDIRNLFQIGTNEPLLESFNDKSGYPSVHPDDVSGKIIDEYYEYLKQKS